MHFRRPTSSSRLAPIALVLLGALPISACSSPPDDQTPSPTTAPIAFVLMSNYQAGGYALVHPDLSVTRGPDQTHGDATFREQAGLIYVVNRLGADNIQVLDPAQSFRTVHQFSVGAGSNPQDIAVVSPSRAYVALYNSDALAIVDPQTGASLGEVDLSAFVQDDPDGLPEVASVLQVQNALLVTLQRLERTAEGYLPLGRSYLVRVDLATDQVDASLVLACTNPFDRLELLPDGQTLLLAEPGRFNQPSDGCLERIDALAFRSEGVLVREASLGADISGVSATLERTFLVLNRVTGDGSVTEVVELVGASGETLPLFTPGVWAVWDTWLDDRGALWVSDRSLSAPGLHIFEDGDPARHAFVPFGSGLLPPTSGRKW